VPTEDLWLKVMYSRSRFDRETIDRLLNHFVHVLTAIAENPDRRLIELPLLTEIEVGLLAQWNRSETAYPRDSTIPELFEEQAQKTPEAVAVSVEGEVLTYGALRDRAARLTRLLRERVVSETIVGICVDRADDLVTAMLGILKAGGAYLPMDATHPEEHLAFMLENAQAKALVTSRLFAPRLKALGLPVIELESLDECDYPTSDLPPRLTAESLAYVMYTSGSTGRPKGIAVPHRAVIRLVRNTDYVALGPEDRVAQASNPSFDASTFEIWGALLNGARLVSIRKEVLLSPEELTEAFARDRITTLFITTDLFNQLAVESPWIFRPLRVLLYGGSAVNPRRVREILEQGRPERLVHCYGPTESTTFASWHEVGEVTEKTQTVPIGRPIANTWLYVLDDFGRFSPIGVAGELYIGGDGVARGYINKPDLTAEKFVPDPFSGRAGARMYRTGDRVLRRADGTIEFVGRLDSQVKIRGFRVELGEIEAVLQSLPGVANAVVLLREDATGAKRLLAFVVTANSDVSVTDLRRLLERKLPDFMMPSTIVLRETLPLTPNGKVDRAALALAGNEAAVAERAFVEPRTPAERSLAEIWRNVLDLKRVGIHDNFFELGGDSIVSIQVIARAREAGLYLTLRQLFQNQTVAQLAAVVGSEPGPRSDQGLLSGNVPLLPIQRWFFEQEPVDAHRFNMASLVETPAGLDSSLLARVTRHLMTHHDALRLRFTQKGGRWQQFCEASVDPTPFAVVDLRTVSEQDATGRIEQGAADAQASLNLESGPILRIVWFDRGELPGRILFVIHHLVMDNVSWRILLEDFWHAYESLARGEDVQLPPKTSSLGHWANRLQEYAQSAAIRNELAFWIDAGSAAGHTPLDMEGGENLADLAESVTVELDEDNTQALVKETPRAYQTQINDVLLTALAQTLARWTGEDTVKFDLEGHGRELLFDDIDLTRTVGWFTSIFPVRLRVPSGHAGDTLISVKEQLRQIPHHGVTYGVLRYLTGDDEVARLFTNSVPDVAFNYQGQFGAIKELESTGASRSPRARRAHLIEINAAIVGGRLRAHWEFSKRHHHFATIEAVASEFKNRLLELISHTCSRQDTSFTPSDFGEAGISQRDLDKLLGAIKRTERPAV
jgi:amino acid adenylation domain-containing protein/non-ribosomal peptide synthase protein (TIGR01720 family)